MPRAFSLVFPKKQGNSLYFPLAAAEQNEHLRRVVSQTSRNYNHAHISIDFFFFFLTEYLF